MHMTGDISNLHDIQTINDGYVSFTGKEKKERSQMGTVFYSVLKKSNFSFGNDTLLEGLNCIFCKSILFLVKFVHILPYAQI